MDLHFTFQITQLIYWDQNFSNEQSGFNWPPRSCGLSPLDYFLRVYGKSEVYKNNTQSIPPFKEDSIMSKCYVKLQQVSGAAEGSHFIHKCHV